MSKLDWDIAVTALNWGMVVANLVILVVIIRMDSR